MNQCFLLFWLSSALAQSSSIESPRRSELSSELMFTKYVASPIEMKWKDMAMTTNVHGKGCHLWESNGPFYKELVEDVSKGYYFSNASYFESKNTKGNIVREYIEPLFSSLRHPLTMALPEYSTRAQIMNKTYYQFPNNLNDNTRILFFDLGASLYDSGAGGDNGASLRWFWEKYSKLSGKKIPFYRIFAWEAKEYKQKDLWSSFPPEIISRLSYFNVPADATKGSKMNPWRVLMDVAQKTDHVIVKLDVDNQAVELALVAQLLSPPFKIASLIDELFWEHHVAGSIVACPHLWKRRNYRLAGWRRMKFNLTEPSAETIGASYSFFTQLRELGIRAHSWV